MNKATDKPPTAEEQRAGKKLERALDAAGLNPTQFAELLREQEGLTSGYQIVRNWRSGRGFNKTNRKRCVRLLGLPEDYFDEPQDAARTAPSLPKTRSAYLAKLLGAGDLKRFTVEGLLALDKTNEYPDRTWDAFVAIHEGFAATRESPGRPSSIVRVVPPPGKPTRPRSKR